MSWERKTTRKLVLDYYSTQLRVCFECSRFQLTMWECMPKRVRARLRTLYTPEYERKKKNLCAFFRSFSFTAVGRYYYMICNSVREKFNTKLQRLVCILPSFFPKSMWCVCTIFFFVRLFCIHFPIRISAVNNG